MLDRALASVDAQNRFVDEIIVVDDGSQDTTSQMIHKTYPHVRLVRTAGVGPGPARNAGIAEARGEVLFFLDSDDIWLPDHVERLMHLFTSGCVVAYASVLNMDNISNSEFLVPEPGREPSGDSFDNILTWCSVMVSGCAVLKKEFCAMGGFGETGFEDWSFFLRLAERHFFTWGGPGATVVRTLHGESLSAKADPLTICQALEQLGQESHRYLRHSRRVHRRFMELATWTKNQPNTWQSIQQWYQALSLAGLL